MDNAQRITHVAINPKVKTNHTAPDQERAAALIQVAKVTLKAPAQGLKANVKVRRKVTTPLQTVVQLAALERDLQPIQHVNYRR
jgi:hypothetical protein